MSGYQPFPDPFADPSIAQATNPKPTSPLEDFNPFANNQPRNEPAVLPTNNSFNATPSTTITMPTSIPSASTSNNQSSSGNTVTFPTQPTLSHAELQRRQEELERKAAELAAKEESLRHLHGSVPKPNNWPPLPAFFPIGPCFYQDIQVDIRPEFQTIVRNAYYLWLAYVGVLLFNLFTVIVLEVNNVFTDEANKILPSILVVLFFTPLSYIGWFRPLYKAFQSDSSFNFMIFFFVFFCHLAFSILFAFGITGSSCGLFSLFTLTKQSIGLELLGFLNIILVCGNALANLLLMTKVHAIYKRSDASFSKAQEEFFSNQHVQTATQAAMQSAARHTANSMFAPNAPQTQSSGLRF